MGAVNREESPGVRPLGKLMHQSSKTLGTDGNVDSLENEMKQSRKSRSAGVPKTIHKRMGNT